MFLDELPEFLDNYNSLPGQLYTLGDINIHYDHPLDPLDILNMYNLKQTVVQSTHRQGHVSEWVTVRPDEGIHQSINLHRFLFLFLTYSSPCRNVLMTLNPV